MPVLSDGGGGAGVAWQNMLRSVGQKVHNPVEKGGIDAQGSKFIGQDGGDERWVEVDRRHRCVCVTVCEHTAHCILCAFSAEVNLVWVGGSSWGVPELVIQSTS